MAAQHDGVLASHQGVVADVVVSGSVGDIAGGEDVVLTDDLQVAVHVQPAQMIAFGGDLLGQ
ncbi:hypothetical protein PS710_00001 [Pseudomonas fluorescens]|uniref:Uncharacterized protein n=1 Tax=Pseudomonas fluorescens TaxID=294 RepID=A0A5E6ZEF5_PSEFL|nr:hypothetical protein PS710_00001 [Pseudomonas fluorescens]